MARFFLARTQNRQSERIQQNQFDFVDSLDSLWIEMDSLGIPSDFCWLGMNSLWIALDCFGYLWIPLDSCGLRWILRANQKN